MVTPEATQLVLCVKRPTLLRLRSASFTLAPRTPLLALLALEAAPQPLATETLVTRFLIAADAEDAATGTCSPLGSPLSPSRSLQHHLPCSLGRSASSLASLRPQLLSWELDCAAHSQEELVSSARRTCVPGGACR